MSNFEDRLAASEERVSAEKEAAIAAAGAALAIQGTATCQRCGEPISAERRASLPSARRCIDCQRVGERRRARR